MGVCVQGQELSTKQGRPLEAVSLLKKYYSNAEMVNDGVEM